MAHSAITRLAALGAGGVLAVLTITACVAEPAPTQSSAAADAPHTSQPSPSASASIAAFPIGPSVSTTALPADLPQGCRDILDQDVLDELDGVPLNAEGMGGGIRADSARVCVWGDPGAVGTRLVTVIGYSPEREARDALYTLSTQGYTCYEPRDGIRCEKTWDHPTLPVTEGRTLFYRDGVIVDTQYTNLAPAGYTDAIINTLWVRGLPTPTPSVSPSATPSASAATAP